MAALSKSTFCMKKTIGNTIDEDNVRDRSETTHNTGDEGMGKADVGESSLEVRPKGAVKGFGHIGFKNNGLFMELFD